MYLFLEEVDLFQGDYLFFSNNYQGLENLLRWSIWYFFVEFFFQGKLKEKEEQLVKVNVSFIVAVDVHLHDVLVCFLFLLHLEFIAFKLYFFFVYASVVKFEILSELLPLAFIIIS